MRHELEPLDEERLQVLRFLRLRDLEESARDDVERSILTNDGALSTSRTPNAITSGLRTVRPVAVIRPSICLS